MPTLGIGLSLTPRHLNRYREIVEVLIRHGFGAAVAQLGLDDHLGLPRLFRRQTRSSSVKPAEHLRLALEELGPTFIKLGQILSTRPDLIPPSYFAELGRLQDKVPSEAWPAIKAQIEKELGQPLERCFVSIEPEPLAAASLGQVHLATLPDGREVVVKVQRPNIEPKINLDLDILHDLARLAQERTPLGQVYDLLEIAEDFAITLHTELDYRREGRNAERFRLNFNDEPELHVPQIYWEYTSQRVMVMERLDGIKIDDVQALDAAGYDRGQIAATCARMIIKEILEEGFFHADPHPGNFVVLPGGVIGAMDFGKVGTIDRAGQAALLRFFIYLFQSDLVGTVDQLIRMGVASERVNRAALERDIGRLLKKYYGLPLQDIQLGGILEGIITIAFRHRLNLSSDLWQLIKTLAMMEGIGLTLDPNFDIFAVAEPYVRRFRRNLWLPAEWGPAFLHSGADLIDLLQRLPRQTARLLDQVERGEMSARVRLPDLLLATQRLDKIANRLAITILTAALIIALAGLIDILDFSWPWPWVTWLILVLFITANLMGLWLLWSIWRSGQELPRK
jgi:ubiquinone biosynthesis protein